MEAIVTSVNSEPAHVGIHWAVKVYYKADDKLGSTTLMLRSQEEAESVVVGYIFNL